MLSKIAKQNFNVLQFSMGLTRSKWVVSVLGVSCLEIENLKGIVFLREVNGDEMYNIIVIGIA